MIDCLSILTKPDAVLLSQDKITSGENGADLSLEFIGRDKFIASL